MTFSLSLAPIVLLAAAGAPAEPPASAASAAIEQLRPGWRILHCGVARGVLYVTYADRERAAITPAVPNAAIARACAAAGYPLAAAQQRGADPVLSPTPSAPASRAPAAAAARNRTQPSFTPSAFGSSLSIDARNDSDVTWQCSVNFSWTSDDSGAGPRSVTSQATLAPRQHNRVASISGAYRNIRFVGSPSWFCNPAE